jgi:hypothetical protein
MRKTLLPLFLLALFSFKSADRDVSDSAAKCKPYFQFDQVVHYKFVLPEDPIWIIHNDILLDTVKDPSEKERFKTIRKYLESDQILTQLADTTSFVKMEQFGFEKHEISKELFGKLNELFCDRKHKEYHIGACSPIYHDLLVFRNQNRTIGFARICFSCKEAVIVGSKENTGRFGQSGDFAKLKELLGYQWYERR